MFLFNINVFGFKKPKLKNNNFWWKGGLQQNGFFFIDLCFARCEKLSFFVAAFLVNFDWCSKRTIKIGISAHFYNKKKQKLKKKIHFEVLLSGPSRCYYLGQVDCNLKMVNLGPDNNTSNLRAQSFFQKKGAETHIL